MVGQGSNLDTVVGSVWQLGLLNMPPQAVEQILIGLQKFRPNRLCFLLAAQGYQLDAPRRTFGFLNCLVWYYRRHLGGWGRRRRR